MNVVMKAVHDVVLGVVLGVVVGGLIVAVIGSMYIQRDIEAFMFIGNGPGVIRICDDEIGPWDCIDVGIGEISVPAERYLLWVRE